MDHSLMEPFTVPQILRQNNDAMLREIIFAQKWQKLIKKQKRNW